MGVGTMAVPGPELRARLATMVRPRPLSVHGVADCSSGYGQMCREVCRALVAEGSRLSIYPFHTDKSHLPHDEFLREHIDRRRRPGPFLSIAGPAYRVNPGSIAYTMWESKEPLPHFVKNLNRAACVVVPCDDNADWFRDWGVSVPIRVVPLGIDTGVYHPTIPEPKVFTVGVAGRIGPIAPGMGDRKCLGLMARLFVRAFPNEDVRLQVKCFATCKPQGVPDDPRISFVREALPDLAGWYRGLSVFASASLGEGWGLQPHQAMACGRPTIAPFWGGHRQYMAPETSWPVAFTDPDVCRIDEWSMIGRLREAYHDRAARVAKGRAAALCAAEFTWERTGRELARVLREFGLWA